MEVSAQQSGEAKDGTRGGASEDARQGGPGDCDWGGAAVSDMATKEGRLEMRLHELSIVSDPSGTPARKQERDYVKVKVRCAECGYVNVVVGHRSLSTLAPLR